MRTARLDYVDCYYLLSNYAIGKTTFDEEARRFLRERVKRLTDFYLFEVIDCTVTANSWHVILYVPPEGPDVTTTITRYNQYYADNPLKAELTPKDKGYCAWEGARMVDVGHFVREFQQVFSQRYNVNRNLRRSTRKRPNPPLWIDRYKSVLLDETAVAPALKYVWLAPVRAGLVADPAEYPFSSLGDWSVNGKNAFAQSFRKHLRIVLNSRAKRLSADGIRDLLVADMKKAVEEEKSTNWRKEHEAYRAETGFMYPFDLDGNHNCDYWKTGALIGSEEFAKVMSEELSSVTRRKHIRLVPSRGGDTQLFAYRQPRRK